MRRYYLLHIKRHFHDNLKPLPIHDSNVATDMNPFDYIIKINIDSPVYTILINYWEISEEQYLKLR